MEIPEPPNIRACSGCNRPLLWMYSARKSAWVAFVPNDADRTLLAHPCGSAGEDRQPSWRDARVPGTEPEPEAAERAHRGAALVAAELAAWRRRQPSTDEPTTES